MINEQECLTVAQITKYIKTKFDVDPYLNQKVLLVGQLTDFRQRSGHQYFSLKDDDDKIKNPAKIRIVMFKSAFQKVKFQPENGMKVVLQGWISVYEPTGSYQFYAEQMEVAGVGSLQIAFEQMYKKLKAEGLFDRPHRLIPPFPKQIAVVTSPNGAVMHDIITTMRRRNRLVQLIFYPTRVQGETAANEIATQIEHVNQDGGYDALIIARGGGSLEDLWPFNEEVVGRSIAASTIPVISSIGHETDTTIADLAADVRAATPTAAAEIASAWELSDVVATVDELQIQLYRQMKNRLQDLKRYVASLVDNSILQTPDRLLARSMQQVDELLHQLTTTLNSELQVKERQYQQMRDRLISQSPTKKLARQNLLRVQISQQLIHAYQSQLSAKQALLTNTSQQLRFAYQAQLNRQRQSLKNLNQQVTTISRQLISEENYRLKGLEQVTDALIDQLDSLSPLNLLKRGYTYVTDEQQTVITGMDQLELGQTVELHFANGKALAEIKNKEDEVL